MAYKQYTPDFDKQDENRIRSKQDTNADFTGYSTELGQDVRKDYIKTCRSELSAQNDNSQALTEIAISHQTDQGGLDISNTAPSPSTQSPNSVFEERMEDIHNEIMIPRSEFEPECLPDLGVKSNSSKTFRCEHCSKTFTRLYNLKSHLVTHDRTMPYSCNICKRPFARKSDAKRHMRTHSGEKNWVCGGCQTPFARRDMLSSHHKSQKGQACLRRQQSQWAQRDGLEKSQSPKILSISSLLS